MIKKNNARRFNTEVQRKRVRRVKFELSQT